MISECGGTLIQSEGTIMSPGYPNKRYRPNDKTFYYCSWKITVPSDRRVTLKVIDFDLTLLGGSDAVGSNNEQRVNVSK